MYKRQGYDGVLNFETFPSMNSFPESVKEEVLRTIAGIGRYFAGRIEFFGKGVNGKHEWKI